MLQENRLSSHRSRAAKSISVGDDELWLEMNNGCLCCSVRDTGLLAILALMEKKGRFDQIVLETTGLADPAPIIQAFWNEPALNIGECSVKTLLTELTGLGYRCGARRGRGSSGCCGDREGAPSTRACLP